MIYDFLEELDEDLGDDDLRHWYAYNTRSNTSHQTIHDQLQFQADIDFDLTTSRADEKSKHYRVDTYFFLPTSMGIQRENFSREQFYTALTHYLRVRTPASPFENEEKGLIPAADRYFRVHLISHLREPLEALVVQEVKLFGCYLNTQYKKLQRYLWELQHKRPRNLEHRLKMLEALLVRILQTLSDFRLQYVGKVRHQSYLVDQEVHKAFLLVDEYLSYRLEETLIKMYQHLNNIPHSQRLSEVIQATLASEMEYRQSEDLIQLHEATEISRRETYYYRLGLLKKYVSDVLFLQVRNQRKDKAYRNLIAASGAALAAIWAGVIDLQRFYMLSQTHENFPFSDFALRFFMIVIVGSIAYIFKDRIKELSREFFYERLKQYLPDHEFEIVYPYYDHHAQAARDLKVGHAHQFMRFLSREGLPPEVLYIRELGHRTNLDPERNEHILHFSQTLRIDTQRIEDNLEQIRTLRNIMRYNIATFLEKLDDPNKNLRYYDPETGIKMIKAPKVYHVNVLFRYASHYVDRKGKSSPEQIEFERIRLILDKQGIQRIETVLPRGALGYEEDHL